MTWLQLMVFSSIFMLVMAVLVAIIIVAAHAWTKNFWSDPNTWTWFLVLAVCIGLSALFWKLRK